jgi:hypothetical protein
LFLFKQRARKSLKYEILANTSLLSNKKEIKGKLKILFEEMPVEDVHLIVVKIINSGNVPIAQTDYEQPISLRFSAKSQILTSEISDTNPKGLPATATIDDSQIILNPILLNNGDTITVKMLVNQFDGNIDVNGRINGVKEIKKLRSSIIFPVVLLIGGAILMAIATIRLFVQGQLQSMILLEVSNFDIWAEITMAIGLTMSYAGMIIILLNKRFREFLYTPFRRII